MRRGDGERGNDETLTSSSTHDSHLLSASNREGKIVENRSSGFRVASSQVLDDDISRGWPRGWRLRLLGEGWFLRDSRSEVVDDPLEGVG